MIDFFGDDFFASDFWGNDFFGDGDDGQVFSTASAHGTSSAIAYGTVVVVTPPQQHFGGGGGVAWESVARPRRVVVNATAASLSSSYARAHATVLVRATAKSRSKSTARAAATTILRPLGAVRPIGAVRPLRPLRAGDFTDYVPLAQRGRR